LNAKNTCTKEGQEAVTNLWLKGIQTNDVCIRVTVQ
jgi:hypothetical protein